MLGWVRGSVLSTFQSCPQVDKRGARGMQCPVMAVSLSPPHEARVFQLSLGEGASGFYSWLQLPRSQRVVLAPFSLWSSGFSTFRTSILEQGSLADHFVCVTTCAHTHTHKHLHTYLCSHTYHLSQAKVSMKPQSIEQVNRGFGR